MCQYDCNWINNIFSQYKKDFSFKAMCHAWHLAQHCLMTSTPEREVRRSSAQRNIYVCMNNIDIYINMCVYICMRYIQAILSQFPRTEVAWRSESLWRVKGNRATNSLSPSTPNSIALTHQGTRSPEWLTLPPSTTHTSTQALRVAWCEDQVKQAQPPRPGQSGGGKEEGALPRNRQSSPDELLEAPFTMLDY